MLRLKLAEERFSFNDKDIPYKIQQSSSYIKYKKELQSQITGNNWEYEEHLHSLTLSFLGQNFCDICI